MAYENYLSSILLLFLCWRIITAQDTVEEDQSGSHKLSLTTTTKQLRFNPDMRMMLNGLLHFDNPAKRSSYQQQQLQNYPFLQLANRSKGSNQPPVVEDPIAQLANGFLGSRGKRDDYDEIPVFANGFPAGRG